MSKKKSSIYDALEDRRHVREFDTEFNVRESLIDVLLMKTWKVSPSKQNFMPYQVHVLGKEHQVYKDKLFNLMLKNEVVNDDNKKTVEEIWDEKYKGKFLPSYASVKNCAYALIFQLRQPDSKDLNKYQKHLIDDRGHQYQQLDERELQVGQDAIQFEAGLFANTFSALCLENNLDTSFFQCFPKDLAKWTDFPFITNTPLVVMTVGKGKSYRQDFRDVRTDLKPDYAKIVNFVD
jgi:hypothetical protein